MKPNFALSLSFEGIRLLHRSGVGWTIVGDVPLDSPDLRAELAVLRQRALALDPAGMRTKILLPNDQIRYIALDTTRATEDDVRAALEGATPYAVDELVYDFVRGGGRTYVAAVARETLGEAEAFATEHRFAPVSFAGVPEAFTYVGEAFFGQTAAAVTLLPPGTRIERDKEPVAVKSAARQVPPVTIEKAEKPRPVPETDAVEDVPKEEAPTPPAAEPVLPPAAPMTAPVATPDDSAATAPKVAPAFALPPLSDDTAEPAADQILTTLAKPAPIHEPAPPVDEATGQDAQPVHALAEVANVAPAPEPAPADKIVTSTLALMAGTDDPAPAPTPDDEPVFASRARTIRPEARAEPTLKRPPMPLPPERAAMADPTEGEPLRSGTIFMRRVSGDTNTAPGMTPGDQVARRTDAPAFPPPPPLRSLSGGPPPNTGPARPLTGEAAGTDGGTRRFAPRMTAGQTADPGDTGLPKGPSLRAGGVPGVSAAAPAVTGLAAGARAPVTIAAKVAPPRREPLGTAPKASADSTDAPAGRLPFRLPQRAVSPKDSATPQSTDAGTGLGRFASAPGGGRSRYLWLILTVVLLVILAAVAAVAALSDGVMTRLFGADGENAAVAALPEPGSVIDPAAVSAFTTDTAPPDAGAQPVSEGVALAPTNAGEPDPALAASNQSAQPGLSDAATAAAAAAVALAIAELAAPDTSEAPEPTVTADLAPESAGTPVSPEEADRFYAATGVWLRAARLPLIPRTEALEGLYTAVVDAAPPERSAPTAMLALLSSAAPDPGLVPQPDPPGPGSSYPRDDRGFILATSEGTLSPRGILIFAGRPSVPPRNRPETITAAAEVEAEPEVTAVVGAEDGAETVAEAADLPEAAEDALPGGVSLAGLRPRERPEGILPPPEAETPVAADEPLVAFDGPRPALRPAGLAPAAPEPEAPEREPETLPEAEVPTAEPVDPAAAVAATLAAIVESAPDPLAGVTPQAVAVARRPDARPRNFDRVVAQQSARSSQPSQQTASTQSAGIQAAPAQPRQQEQTTAPTVAVPSGPVATSVARAATIPGAINLRDVNLIGVFGRPNERRALVRLSNGRYQRVGVGDSLDGGQVTAISDNQLNYVKRGRTITLTIPSG
jgi:hypothetical protein